MTVKETALRNLQRALINDEVFAIHSYVETSIFGRECYCAVGHLMKDCGIDMKPILEDGHLNTRAIYYDGLDSLVEKMEQAGFTLEELETMQGFNDRQDFDSLLRYVNRLLGESE